MLLHPHRLPDGAVRGRATRGGRAIRGGAGINPGIRCGCLSCGSGGRSDYAAAVQVAVYNRATFQAHLAAFAAFLAILTLEIKRKVAGPMMHSAELSKSLKREECK